MQLLTPTGAGGTCFCVAPGYALSVAHHVRTVSTGGAVTVITSDERRFDAEVVECVLTEIDGKLYPDISLLRVPLLDVPYLELTSYSPDDDEAVYLYGYSQKSKYGRLGSAKISGVPNAGPADDNVLFDFQGPHVPDGFSGSPLALTDYRVIAIVKATYGSNDAKGGTAIPVEVVLRHLPLVRELQNGLFQTLDEMGVRAADIRPHVEVAPPPVREQLAISNIGVSPRPDYLRLLDNAAASMNIDGEQLLVDVDQLRKDLMPRSARTRLEGFIYDEGRFELIRPDLKAKLKRKLGVTFLEDHEPQLDRAASLLREAHDHHPDPEEEALLSAKIAFYRDGPKAALEELS